MSVFHLLANYIHCMKLSNHLSYSKSFLPNNNTLSIIPLNSLTLHHQQSSPMASFSPEPKHYQKIIVMRHGDRMDNSDSTWLSNAIRKWDPPLDDEGHRRAVSSGENLQKSLGYPIHRIFVSPFLRCLQTAFRVALPLCHNHNPSNIKVSIQYGLSELFNNIAIRHPPMEGQEWGFDHLSDLQKELPAGTVDTTCQQVNAELPKWGETSDDARARYELVIRTLADKYPYENLMFVTHGEGLKATVATFMGDLKIRKVQYCGYLVLHREILRAGKESFEAGEFELLQDQSVGMTFTSLISNGSVH